MTTMALRVAARFTAAMDPAKMEVLLTKIRKGATASVTLKQIGEVLAVLDPGWKFEKSKGLVKLYGRSDSDRPEFYFDEDKGQVERRRESLMKDAVTSLPSSPKPNQLYVLDLTEVLPGDKALHYKDSFYFECKPWMGAEGWKVTTPTGRSQEFYPGRYDYGELRFGYKPRKAGDVRAYEIIAWLSKETDWLEQINKKLGVGTYEKAAPRTRDGSGSCPVCFQNIKLKDEEMVLHGYKRPGSGSTHGRCFGVGYPAFELKVDGTKDFLEQSLIPKFQKTLKAYTMAASGKVDQFMKGEKLITKEDPLWDYELKMYTASLKHSLEAAQATVEVYSRLVSNWKVRPLPKEGEPVINWYLKGQKD